MSAQRDLRQDLFALALLALTIFLGLALGSYDPADPVSRIAAELGGWYPADVLVLPQHERVQNACGRWGALAADALFQSLGWGAWYVVFSLAVVDLALLRRREIDAPLTRTIGWLASLVALTTLVAMLGPQLSPGPVIGSGGYLGTLCSGLLKMHFATAGGLILVFSLLAGGLLLSTDYALFQLARGLFALSGNTVAGGRQWIARRPSRRSGRRSGTRNERAAAADADDEEAEEQDDEMSVRIGGRKLKRSDAESLELDKHGETDDELDWRDEEDVEEDEDEDEDLDMEDADDDEEGDDEEDDEEAWGEDEAEKEPESQPAGAPTSGSKRPRTSLKVRKPARKSEREVVIESLEAAALNEDAGSYQLPSLELLIDGDDISFDEQAKEVRHKAKILEKTFADFGFRVKVVEIETGPVIAQYEVQLEAGLRLSKITGLADDLAIALRVPSVRIVAPIPGKNTVGIEVPNETRQVVRLREVIEESNGKTKKMRIPLFLGKDVSGNPLTVDLSTLPHLLIAGRTGTGKSVCLNAIINSILMTRRPDEVRLLMIDPKMVELSGYGRLPHLMHPVVTDMRKAEAILAWAVEKMEERYSLLAKAGVRHISSYNQLSEEELIDRLEPEDEEQRKAIPLHLPFIVIVADEMADLMMTAGKEVEQHIIRLAQKSRAVGIHLILATQKPTVDVITGLIKSNLPARISFQVASRTDSRVVLDEMGADKLLGNGDMLFLWPGTSCLLRGQGTYVSDDEINAVVDCVSTGEQNFVNELVNMKVEEAEEVEPGQIRKRDELYESAIDVVVREGRGSVSLLQRTLGIGYGRAARLIDFMAEDSIVGEYNGSQAREVLLSIADWERMQGQDAEAAEEPPPPPAAPPKRRRSNKILPDLEEETTALTLAKASRRGEDSEPLDEDEDYAYEEEDEEEEDWEEDEGDEEADYEGAFEDGYQLEDAYEDEEEDEDACAAADQVEEAAERGDAESPAAEDGEDAVDEHEAEDEYEEDACDEDEYEEEDFEEEEHEADEDAEDEYAGDEYAEDEYEEEGVHAEDASGETRRAAEARDGDVEGETDLKAESA